MTVVLYVVNGKEYDTWREALDAAQGDNFSVRTKQVEIHDKKRISELLKKYEKENEVVRD